MEMPSGTVALLFTDIEASMSLWAADPASMAASLERHDEVVAEQIEIANGYVFTRAGDSFSAAFATAYDAVTAALQCQRSLGRVAWPGPELKVRMGLHIGEAQLRGGDYFGPAVNVAARVADTGHGGQVVATSQMIDAAGSIGLTAPLGSFVLRGNPDRVDLHQIGSGTFPPLRADTAASDVLRFDEFEIDLSARTLRAEGEIVHVEPQVLDVLAYLATHRDQLVSQEELLDEVWGDQFVSASALTTRIKQARKALGDDGRTQRYIRNERGRGYQFLGNVSDQAPGGAAAPNVAATLVQTTVERVAVFGRGDDLAAISDLVATATLTTVAGPGGVGKTTLVRALIADWAADGGNVVPVWLDSVRDEAALMPALSTALGLSGSADDETVEAAAELLSATGAVLVLDNCEHLLGPVRRLVTAIAEAAPSVAVLTTSRHPLGLRSESVHRLQPLSVPDTVSTADADEWPCLELFASAARRAGGSQLFTDDDWAQVLDLCRRLDGLPLAIELAASRLSTLGIRDLVDGLDDRLDWFRNRSVDAGERQRSLRSTVEWSFRFLDDESIDLLAGLAIFPAGLRLADIDALGTALGATTAADELVARLVDASVVTSQVSGGEARFSMLETIRQFGLERLDASPDLRAAAERYLVDHALDVAQAERDAWTGDRDPRDRSLQRLRDEVPNLRSARTVMLERGDRTSAIRLAVGLCAFTEEACLAELWSWYDTADLVVADEPLDDEVAAGLKLIDATAARNLGEIARSRDAAVEAFPLSTDRWVRGRAKHTAAMAALFSGEPLVAGDLWIESDQEMGGCRGRLFAAMAAAFAGDLGLAGEHLAACRIDERRVPVDLLTNVHLVRGEVARVADTGDARIEFEQAVDVARRHGLIYSLGIAQVPLAALREAEGDHSGAAADYRELIDLFLRSGTWTQVWTTLRNAARLLVADAPEAALLVCSAAANDPRSPALDEASQAENDELVATCTRRLGETEADRIVRRASLVSRAVVARETSDALGAIG